MQVLNGYAKEGNPPNKGAIAVYRDGGVQDPVVVYYTISGTATNGVDYEQLSGRARVKPNGVAKIQIVPINGVAREQNETVTLTLIPSPNYTIGSPDSGTVTIKRSRQ